MRVLLAHKFFRITGGAEVFFFDLGRVLAAQGHDVAWFSTRDPDNEPNDFASYFVEPPRYKEGNLIARAAGIGRLIYSRKAKQRFSDLISHFKPDIIHVFAIHVHLTPSILVAAQMARVPVVMSCNDYKHICPNYKLYHHGRICTDCRGGRFYNAILNRCCQNSVSFSVASCLEAYAHAMMNIYGRMVDTFLFASEFMAKETEQFWGPGAFRWRLLRNPFDSCEFPLIARDGGYALYFGRFVEEKGVEVLIRAAATIPTIRFKLVGDGPLRKSLEDLATNLKVRNVEFCGPLWGQELNAELSMARFVVVPSLWHENFPYVILQSFAYGKPVLGSNRGGIPELVVDGERGLIYDAPDSVALARAAEVMWRDAERCREMGRRAKEFADLNFNDQKFYESLIGIYREVVGARTSTRQ